MHTKPPEGSRTEEELKGAEGDSARLRQLPGARSPPRRCPHSCVSCRLGLQTDGAQERSRWQHGHCWRSRSVQSLGHAARSFLLIPQLLPCCWPPPLSPSGTFLCGRWKTQKSSPFTMTVMPPHLVPCTRQPCLNLHTLCPWILGRSDVGPENLYCSESSKAADAPGDPPEDPLRTTV